MAGSPWTCEQCGEVNEDTGGVCGVCGAPAPPPERNRARALWALLALVVVAGAAVGATFLFDANHRPPPAPAVQFPLYTTPVIPSTTTPAATSTTATTTRPTPTASGTIAVGPPCPAAAAQYLPGGAGITVLVAQTEKSVITICETPDGGLFYDGQARGQDPSPTTHLALPAQRSGDGYLAVNGDYRYQVGGGRLVVSTKSGVLSDDALTPVS